MDNLLQDLIGKVVLIVEKARGWTDEQKIQAAIQILGVLAKEGQPQLEPDSWEFIPSQQPGYLMGPSPRGGSFWVV